MTTATPKSGKVYRFEGLEFYAFDGAIKLHDKRDGQIRFINPVDFLERAAALYAEIPHQRHYDEKLKYQRMAQSVEAACKEAVEMGNPFDPKVQMFRAKYAKMNRPVVVQGGYVATQGGVIVPQSALVQADRPGS